MNEAVYLACDFSGIQRYVLAVKIAGKAQAKRLRARSFRVELFERAALWTVRDRLDIAPENYDVLVIGGGGFQVKLPPGTDTDRLEQINSELQRKLWDETGGELQFSMAWAETYHESRRRLEDRKRRAGATILQSGGSWNPDRLSRPTLDRPCEICQQFPGQEWKQEEDERVLHCESCLKARKLGENLTLWEWMRPAPGGLVTALGVDFTPSDNSHPESFHAARWVPHNRGQPLTFEDIAEQSAGVRRLAVLKADVDDMGMKVGKMVGDGASDARLRWLRSFNRDLGRFFGEAVQELLERSWPSIYTLYSGGDDLLMVGPWKHRPGLRRRTEKRIQGRCGRRV